MNIGTLVRTTIKIALVIIPIVVEALNKGNK